LAPSKTTKDAKKLRGAIDRNIEVLKDTKAILNELRELRTDFRTERMISFFRGVGAIILSIGLATTSLSFSFQHIELSIAGSFYSLGGALFLVQSAGVPRLSEKRIKRGRWQTIKYFIETFPNAFYGLMYMTSGAVTIFSLLFGSILFVVSFLIAAVHFIYSGAKMIHNKPRKKSAS
jgi:hypothetical protein